MTDSPSNDIEEMDADIAAWTAGSLLQREREQQGLTEKEVADQLHITMHYVRAIEADSYDKLPGRVFARGYIKSYALMLGLEEHEILSLYDSMSKGPVVQQTRSVSRVATSRNRQRSLYWLVLAIVAFLLGYLVFWAYNTFIDTSQATAGSGGLMGNPSAAVSGSEGTTMVAAGAVLRGRDSRAGGAPVGTTATEQEQVRRGTVDHEIMAGSHLTEVVTLGSDRLEVRFDSNGWIDVSGADDRAIYRDLHRPGDVLLITGRAPFNIQVGDARSVSIRLNERDIDLETEIRIDNTARLIVGT